MRLSAGPLMRSTLSMMSVSRKGRAKTSSTPSSQAAKDGALGSARTRMEQGWLPRRLLFEAVAVLVIGPTPQIKTSGASCSRASLASATKRHDDLGGLGLRRGARDRAQALRRAP